MRDTVSKRWVKKNLRGRTSRRLARNSAVVIVLVAGGEKATREGRKLRVEGVVLDFYARGSECDAMPIK